MLISRLSKALVVAAAMVLPARAELIPPSPVATIVNFDDIPGAIDALTVPAPISTEYVSRGVNFTGFGSNGGGVVALAFGQPEASPPNFLLFASAFPMGNGGLMQTPETLTFYPPITSFQFDTGTLQIDCLGTSIVNVQAFAPDGAPIAFTSQVAALEGTTIALDFEPPGAERVVVTSTHTCGPPEFLFFGVELFSMDNVAYTFVAQPASKCVQGGIDAAGKKAKARSACYAKASQTGLPVDETCLQKATDQFTKAFAKAVEKGDCLTEADVASVEGQVDSFISNAITLATGGAPGPDICHSKRLAAAGKKAQDVTKCHATAAKNGAEVDLDCGFKAQKKFESSLKKCNSTSQLLALESAIDIFSSDVARTLSVPTTTTSTTTSTSTTTTTAPPLGQRLEFTTTAGTANCGAAKLNPPADAPFSGEIDSDAAGTTKIADLGLGCLYIGGGNSSIPASRIPENATSILDSADGTTLTASFGTGPANCSKGPLATKHCVNAPDVTCSADVDCGGAAGACQGDALCFFGPPLLVEGFPPSCVVNAFAQDASGTIDLATGTSSVNITLASRVYLTLGQPSVCPQCIEGTCNYGANQGGACTTNNAALTSLDCQPQPGIFVATLPVDLSPLTTGPITSSAADGLFCAGQTHAGAFGLPAAQAITQTGSPAGDLTDGLPHASTLVSNICIPPTGFSALDNLADLPGPGTLSLPGNAQFFGEIM